MKKNDKGFILISLLTVLPVLLALVLATLSMIDVLKKDLEVKYICRTELLAAQKENEKNILSLLKLNRRAESLKQKKTAAERALFLAKARLDPLGIAASKALLAFIHSQQLALAAEQKALIAIANQSIQLRQRNLESKIRSIFKSSSQASMSYRLTSLRSSKTLLAVRPVKADIAPSYERVPDFSKAQSMELHWQYEQSPHRVFSNFLKYSGSNEYICIATLKKSRDQWIAKIHKGKYL